MDRYLLYRFVHLSGLVLITYALATYFSLNEQTAKGDRRFWAALHGAGLTLILISGFGMTARLGLHAEGLPGWVLGKLALWLVLGFSLFAIKRSLSQRKFYWKCVVVTCLLAACFLAVFKP